MTHRFLHRESRTWSKHTWLSSAPFLVGTFVQSSDPAVIEILAEAEFDFLVVDCEHGAYSDETVKDLLTAASAGSIVKLVRVRKNESPLVASALDSGAFGVQIPHVATAQNAVEAVGNAKYHPLGNRGVNPHVRATRYRQDRFQSYLKWANENILVVIQVEGSEGIGNIDDILDVPGVDIVFLGPYDLSQSLGIPGDVMNPRVVDKMREVIFKAQEQSVAVGTFTDNADAAKQWIDLGVQYMMIGYDTSMLLAGARRVISEVKQAGRT